MKLNSDLSHGKATFKKSICSEYKLTIWVGVSTRLRKGLTTWRKKMKVNTLVLRSLFVLSFLFQSLALASGSYPDGPELTSTPGSLCEIGVKRYPENIIYCERDVDTQLKKEIIRKYDQEFGYHIQTMPRDQFKIDHFIPLSIGGSNSITNLWPQHHSVYEITDPVEHLLGQKIAEAKVKQVEAIKLIREVKMNLSKAPEVIRYLQGL